MSRGAISVLTAAGLGLAGAAAILGTLSKASPGPSGRPRPTGEANTSPPPHSALGVGATREPEEAVEAPSPAQAATAVESESLGPEEPAEPDRVREIRGIILGPEGEAVPGAVLTGVTPFTGSEETDPLSVTSGPYGSFTWELSRRTEFRAPCTIDAEGYASTDFHMEDSRASYEERTGINSGVVIRMRAGLSIRGTVRYPDGEAASGVTVHSEDVRPVAPAPGPDDLEPSKTDADGRYRLEGRVLGTVQELFVSDRGCVTGPYALPGDSDTVRRVELDLTIPRPRGVRVHVLLRGGSKGTFVGVDHQQSPLPWGEGGTDSFWCGVGWHVLVLSEGKRMGTVRFCVPADCDPFLVEVDVAAIEWVRFPSPPPEDLPPPGDEVPEDR